MNAFLKKFKRGFLLSLFLLSIYYAQILSHFFSLETTAQLIEHSTDSKPIQTLASYIQYFKFYPIYNQFLNTANTTSINSSASQNIECIYFATILNTILILYILIRFRIYVALHFKNDSQQSNNTQLNTANNLAVFNQINPKTAQQYLLSSCDYLASIVFRSYSFLAVLPFGELALFSIFGQYQNSYEQSTIVKTFGVYVLLSTFIIYWLIQIQEFDYSLLITDHLAQLQSLFKYAQLLLDFMSCCMQLSIGLPVQQIFFFMNIGIRAILLLVQQPFNNRTIQRSMVQLCLFMLSIQLCYLVITSNTADIKSHKQIGFLILICIIFPFVLKAGERLNAYFLRKGSYQIPYIENEHQIHARKLDRYLRSNLHLFTIPIESYMQDGNGVAFETIFANHLSFCSAKESSHNESSSHHTHFNTHCYCHRFVHDNYLEKQSIDRAVTNAKQKTMYLVSENDCEQFIQQAIDNKMGFTHRRKFLVLYFINLFKLYFTSNTKNSIDLNLEIKPTFMYFLLQIAKSPSKAYLEIFYLRNQMIKSSLSQQAILQEIITEITCDFQKFLQNCSYQNQRLQIAQVIAFDSKYNEFKSLLREGILQKQRYFEFLYSDFINLNGLQQFSEDCLSKKSDIEHKIIELFNINPGHSKVQHIAEIYIEFFDFKKRRIQHFVRRSQDIMKQSLQRVDYKIDMFLETACSIFISLHSKKIISTSEQASAFFHCDSSKDLIGKHFTQLLPNFIGASFATSINLLLDEGNMDAIKIGELFTYFNRGSNKLILTPVYIRLKIDVIEDGQYGLSMFLSLTQNLRTSIAFSGEFTFLSSTLSAKRIILKQLQSVATATATTIQSTNHQLQPEQIPQSAKQHHKDLDLFRKTNMKNMIPLLYCFDDSYYCDLNNFDGYNELSGFKDQRVNKYAMHKSIMILPRKPEQIAKLNTKVIESPKEIIQYFEEFEWCEYSYFEINFSILKMNAFLNQEDDIRIIDIHSHRLLNKSNEINEFIIRISELLSIKFSQPIPLKRFPSRTDRTRKRSTKRRTMNGITPLNLTRNQIPEPSMIESASRELFPTFKSYIEGLLTERAQLIGSNGGIEDSQMRRQNYNYRTSQDESVQFEQGRNGNLRKGSDSPLLSRRKISNKVNLESSENEIIELTKQSSIQFSPTSISPTTLLNRISSPERLANGVRANLLSEEQTSPYHRKRLTLQPIQFFDQQDTNNQIMSGRSPQKATSFHISNAVNEIYQKLNQQTENFIRDLNKQATLEDGGDDSDDDEDSSRSSKVQMDKENHHEHGMNDPTKNATNSSSFEVNDKHKHHLFDEAQSVRSGQSNIFSQKQSLIEMVISRSEFPSIFYSRILGYFAYAILLGATFLLYFSVQNSYENLQIHYQNLTLGPELTESFTQILHMKELETIIYANSQFPFLYNNFLESEILNFQAEAEEQLVRMTKKIGELQRHHILEGYEESFLIGQSKTEYSNRMKRDNRTLISNSRLYQTILFSLYSQDYLSHGDLFARTFLYENQFRFVENMHVLSSVSQESAAEKLQVTQEIFSLSIIIIEVITLAFVILVFPIYYIVQVKKQEILNLFVTFDSKSLKFIIEKHREALQLDVLQVAAKTKSYDLYAKQPSQIQSEHQQQQQLIMQNRRPNPSNGFFAPSLSNHKKRTISQTNTIPKHSLKVVVSAIVIFILISLYSLLNYLFTANFFENFHFHLEELSFISETKSTIGVNLTGLDLLSNAYVYEFNNKDLGSVLNFLQLSLSPDNQKRIDYFVSLDNHFVSSRYQIQDYNTKFLSIIKNNACDILSTSYAAPFLEQDSKMTQGHSCETVQSGTLSRGILVGLKNYYSKIASIISMFVATNSPSPYAAFAFYSGFHQWDMENNFRELEMQYFFLRDILNAQISFLTDSSSQYFEYLKRISIGLFIYSVIMISFVFWFIWRKFIARMVSEISDTTFLLSIMPVENLLDNPYVQSFVQKQNRIAKGR